MSESALLSRNADADTVAMVGSWVLGFCGTGIKDYSKGIMEKKMETTIVYWGYVGIMENKMETTMMAPKP